MSNLTPGNGWCEYENVGTLETAPQGDALLSSRIPAATGDHPVGAASSAHDDLLSITASELAELRRSHDLVPELAVRIAELRAELRTAYRLLAEAGDNQ